MNFANNLQFCGNLSNKAHPVASEKLSSKVALGVDAKDEFVIKLKFLLFLQNLWINPFSSFKKLKKTGNAVNQW